MPLPEFLGLMGSRLVQLMPISSLQQQPCLDPVVGDGEMLFRYSVLSCRQTCEKPLRCLTSSCNVLCERTYVKQDCLNCNVWQNVLNICILVHVPNKNGFSSHDYDISFSILSPLSRKDLFWKCMIYCLVKKEQWKAYSLQASFE